MEQQTLMGEKVGFHVDPWWERPDPCWGRCSYCWEGQHRYENEERAEKALALIRKWSSICADVDMSSNQGGEHEVPPSR